MWASPAAIIQPEAMGTNASCVTCTMLGRKGTAANACRGLVSQRLGNIGHNDQQAEMVAKAVVCRHACALMILMHLEALVLLEDWITFSSIRAP